MKDFKFTLLNIRNLNVHGMLRKTAIFLQYFRELDWDISSVFVMSHIASISLIPLNSQFDISI